MEAKHRQQEHQHAPPVHRCACGGVVGPTGECASCRAKRLAKEAQTRSKGRALDPATRSSMEHAFGHEFGNVRIHHDQQAVQSLGARAFTLGSNIVTGAPMSVSQQPGATSLLAHELTHVVQQRNRLGSAIQPRASHAAEAEANRAERAVSLGRPVGAVSSQPLSVARQDLDTGLTSDGGTTGDTGSAPAGAAPSAASPGSAMLCSRRLETPVAGLLFNHAYVDDTGRGDCRGAGMLNNYAVVIPVSGNAFSGCFAKSDRSRDPVTYAPNTKRCDPAPGVSDVHKCLRDAFTAYSDPSEYSDSPFRSPMGPNSNSFVATLARTCCADSTSTGLGWVPGWDHAPAGPCPDTTAAPLTDAGDTGQVPE